MDEEIIDTWRALKEHDRVQKQVALKDNVALLEANGIRFERSTTYHLIIRDRGRIYDAWPSSGKWRQRDNTHNPGGMSAHRPSLRGGQGFTGLLAAINNGRKAE